MDYNQLVFETYDTGCVDDGAEEKGGEGKYSFS